MSADIVEESVPTYLRRVGDCVLQGSNNSFIVLGTDRASAGVSGLGAGLGHPGALGGGKGAGSVHLVAGMKDGEGNPDFSADSSFFYLSMKSDADKALGTTMEGNAPVGPVALLKTDSARIVVRNDLKIAFDGSESYIRLTRDSCTLKIQGTGFIRVEKGRVIVDADKVELGAEATERLIKGDTFMNKVFNLHAHQTAVGPSGPPVPQMAMDSLSSRTVMVK